MVQTLCTWTLPGVEFIEISEESNISTYFLTKLLFWNVNMLKHVLKCNHFVFLSEQKSKFYYCLYDMPTWPLLDLSLYHFPWLILLLATLHSLDVLSSLPYWGFCTGCTLCLEHSPFRYPSIWLTSSPLQGLVQMSPSQWSSSYTPYIKKQPAPFLPSALRPI